MVMTNGGNTLRFSVVFLLKWKKRKLEMPRTAQTTMNGTKTSCRSETLAWARNGVANVMVLYHLTMHISGAAPRTCDAKHNGNRRVHCMCVVMPRLVPIRHR